MATSTVKTNKPLNPRGVDNRPVDKYNRAKIYSGKALDFDGVNDTLSTDYAPSSDIQTTAYWVKLDSLTTNYALGGFIKSAPIDQFGLYYFGVESNKNFGFNTWNNDSYGVTLPDFVDDWFHVVAEYNFTDFTQSKLFVNGQELSISQTKGTTLQRTTASRTFEINSPSANNQEVNAQINGVKVFEGSLTAAQVADLYNNPEKVVPTGVADSALKLWLPMQEGAGTTAYDGSGNGNHGTISGATWTHGIGAPVSQTAVIDWNKGTNETDYSDIQQTQSNAAARKWVENSGNPWTPLNATGPTGLANSAGTYTKSTGVTLNDYLYNSQIPVVDGETYTASVWIKLGTASNAVIVVNNSIDWDTISGANYVATAANGYDEWKQVSITFTAPSSNKINIHIGYHQELGVTAQADGTFYVYGVAIHKGSTPILVPTNGTAQTSEVLLPQGLTTGRDITGVNLFENVRKQGALNLDGNSWAEVHDNASVDFADFTLECWVRFDKKTGTYQIFFSKGDSGSDRSFEMYLNNNETQFATNVFGTAVTWNATTINTNQWYHVVCSFEDSSNEFKTYVDGSLNKSASVSETQNNTDAPIIIGTWINKTVSFVNGEIAQPRIYNRALTAAEVKQNYDATKDTYI